MHPFHMLGVIVCLGGSLVLAMHGFACTPSCCTDTTEARPDYGYKFGQKRNLQHRAAHVFRHADASVRLLQHTAAACTSCSPLAGGGDLFTSLRSDGWPSPHGFNFKQSGCSIPRPGVGNTWADVAQPRQPRFSRYAEPTPTTSRLIWP